LSALGWASCRGNAEIVRETLRYWPELEEKDNAHGITALGLAVHESINGWHRDTGGM